MSKATGGGILKQDNQILFRTHYQCINIQADPSLPADPLFQTAFLGIAQHDVRRVSVGLEMPGEKRNLIGPEPLNR